MFKKLLIIFTLSLIFAPSLVWAADKYVTVGFICTTNSTTAGKFSKQGKVILFGSKIGNGVGNGQCTDPNDQACIDKAFVIINNEIKKRSGSGDCVCAQDKNVAPTLTEAQQNSPDIVDNAIKQGGTMCGGTTTGATVTPTSNPLSFIPQVSIPESEFVAEQATPLTDNTSLICDYIIAVYKYGIMIIGVFAVVAMAIGGAMWILAMGNSKLVSMGKDWIISGLLGLALALGAFMILASINKDLVTCNLQTIKKIKRLATPSANDVTSNYVNAGRSCKKPAKSLDSSGQYYCCKLYGDIEMSGWVSDDETIRYATYESASKEEALKECKNFYDGKHFTGNEKDLNSFIGGTFNGVWKMGVGALGSNFIPFLRGLFDVLTVTGGIEVGTASYDFVKSVIGEGKAGLKFEARKPSTMPTDPEDQKKNTAEVYPGACWEIPGIKKSAVGADCPDFCKIKDEFKSCITTIGTEGYCRFGSCQTCKKHCEACVSDRQCPIQTISPTYGMAGVVCGEEYYKASSEMSGHCTSYYEGSGNQKFCDREFDVNGDGDEDDCDTCLKIPDGTLCVTPAGTQGTCRYEVCQPITP